MPGTPFIKNDSKKSVSYSDALHRKNASCRTLSPAAVQLRKLVAAGEIPDTAYACIAVIHFAAAFPRGKPLPEQLQFLFRNRGAEGDRNRHTRSSGLEPFMD